MEPHIVYNTAGAWLVVPYDGPELTVIEIGFGGLWKPAFLDHEGDQRTAMIPHNGRLPAGLLRVRAGGEVIASWNVPAQPRGSITG